MIEICKDEDMLKSVTLKIKDIVCKNSSRKIKENCIFYSLIQLYF